MDDPGDGNDEGQYYRVEGITSEAEFNKMLFLLSLT